jgi:large conductance mechanosensitive channel
VLQDFKAFALRGNVLDLAVGAIIGVAFGKIVSSMVNDVLMPVVGLALGRFDFANLFLNLGSQKFVTLAAAKAAGSPTLNYGLFINAVVDFLVVAWVIFLLARQVNRWTATPEASPTPTTKACPYCLSAIPLKATRCAHCTAEVRAA